MTLGLHGAADHPDYVWRTVRRNARAYFEISPSLNTRAEEIDGRHKLLRTLSLPLFYAVTVVGLVGLVRFRRDRRVLLLGLITAQFVAVSLCSLRRRGYELPSISHAASEWVWHLAASADKRPLRCSTPPVSLSPAWPMCG